MLTTNKKIVESYLDCKLRFERVAKPEYIYGVFKRCNGFNNGCLFTPG